MDYIGGKIRKYINPPMGTGETIERQILNEEPTVTMPKAEFEELLANIEYLSAYSKELKHKCAELVKKKKSNEITITVNGNKIRIK